MLALIGAGCHRLSEIAGRLGKRRAWDIASSWWGPGTDRRPLQVDVVARALDREELLVGEVKWQERLDWAHEATALREKAARLPFVGGRKVRLAIWAKRPPTRPLTGIRCFTPREVMRVLR